MKSHTRIYLYLPLLLALALAIGLLGGRYLDRLSPNGLLSGNPSGISKLQDILNYIEKEYVDSVDRETLTEDAIVALLRDLDPHSAYIPAREYDQVNDPLMGKFEGIGVQFNMPEDTILIIQVIPGGPSEKAGLMAGDRIVTVDGEAVAGKSLTTLDVMRRLKGDKGTRVELEISRRGYADLLPYTIIRDVIPQHSIDISYLPEPGIGYVRLSRFSMTTAEEFDQALKDLKADGMRKLILDLRGNSGGFLDAAIALADEFLPDDQLIVYTEGRARPRRFAYATAAGDWETQPLILLIDEGSASASEILAGAIQDNDRGLILGRRSFGKGLVQEQLQLPDGSGLRLTVARYYSPTGRCIQRPYDQGADAYAMEIMDRFHGGEMESNDSLPVNDSLKYTTPGGKVVYGGGGISPDIFVGLEKDERLGYYNQLINRGILYNYSFSYTDRHRPEMAKFKNTEAFDRGFSPSPVMLQELVDLARREGLPEDPQGLAYARERITALLKAYIARNLIGDQAFFPLYLRTDPAFLRALREMRSGGETAGFVDRGRAQKPSTL
ncbi:MAG TPA: S41 family peptidase [Bacteroidales bacterium]|nr:S41 family peptidase [Bacteroidales bacterium]HRZ75742.1 S41 family peptidase [Bacteroidales bacterium]